MLFKLSLLFLVIGTSLASGFPKTCDELIKLAKDLNSDKVKANDELQKFCQTYVKHEPTCNILIERVFKVLDKVDEKFCDQFTSKSKPFKLAVRSSSNDPTCEFCLNLVKDLEDIITSNKTSAELKFLFEWSCTLVGEYRENCMNLVDDTIDHLIDDVKKEVDSNKVCQKYNLCPHTKQPVKLNKNSFISKIKSPITDLECELCQEVYSLVIKELNTNSTEQAIEHVLDYVCDKFFSEPKRSKCENIVKNTVEEFISGIQEGLTPEMACTLMNICNSPSKKVKITRQVKIEKINDSTCDFCTRAMSDVQDILTSDATVNEIKHLVDGVCRHLRYLKDDCDKLIVDAIKPYLDKLKQRLNPTKMCQSIGACPSKSTVKIANLNLVFKKYEAKAKSNSFISHKTVKNFGCDLCQDAYAFLMREFDNNNTEEVIIDQLNPVCLYVPSSYVVKCENLIRESTRKALTYLRDEITPKSACKFLRACPDQAKLNNQIQILPAVELAPVESSSENSPIHDLECELCKEIYGLVVNELATNRTEQAIEHVLDYVCTKFFSGEKEAKCERIVKNGVEDFISGIKQELSGEIACALMTLCETAPSKVELVQFEAVSSNDTTCDFCINVMKNVQDILTSEETVEYIKHLIDQSCSHLGYLRKDCDKFFEDAIQPYLDELKALLDPEFFCTYFGVCPSNRLVYLNLRNFFEKLELKVKTHNYKSPNSLECDLCEDAYSFMVREFITEENEQALVYRISPVCQMVPKSDVDECEEVVKNITHQALVYLRDDLTPNTACKFLRVCPDTSLVTLQTKPAMSIFKPIFDASCALCKKLDRMLLRGLSSISSEQDIINGLDYVCDKIFFGHKKESCHGYIANYTDKILSALRAGMNPDIICNVIGICNENFYNPLHIFKVIDDLECEICEVAYKYVVEKIDRNSTRDEIEHVLDYSCDHLFSGSKKVKCEMAVNRSTEYFLSAIHQGLSSKIACVFVSMCDVGEIEGYLIDKAINTPDEPELPKASAKVQSFSTLLKNSNEILCDVCKQGYNMLRDRLSQNGTEEEINDGVDRLCEGLCPAVKKCESVIKKLVNETIDLIENQFTAETGCKIIGLCPNDDSPAKQLFFQNKLIGSEKCTFGPSYWCQSAKNAHECNTYHFCLKKVWNKDNNDIRMM